MAAESNSYSNDPTDKVSQKEWERAELYRQEEIKRQNEFMTKHPLKCKSVNEIYAKFLGLNK